MRVNFSSCASRKRMKRRSGYKMRKTFKVLFHQSVTTKTREPFRMTSREIREEVTRVGSLKRVK